MPEIKGKTRRARGNGKERKRSSFTHRARILVISDSASMQKKLDQKVRGKREPKTRGGRLRIAIRTLAIHPKTVLTPQEAAKGRKQPQYPERKGSGKN